MGNKSNCIICGEDIVYADTAVKLVCVYCKNEYMANTCCKNGHYVCDGCHSQPANEIIAKYCAGSGSTNPFEMAQDLMKHPSVKMHGPEHHFLIPAVLLTCYCNSTGDKDSLGDKLAEAQKRAKNVLGGFCGFYGSCGAAIGVGIFMSVALGATPLSKKEWQLANLITSDALREIAQNGGPRCCKRNTFLAFEAATVFLKKNLEIELKAPEDIKCSYYSLNKDCKGVNCRFF